LADPAPVVGTLLVRLYLPEARSLKDKRRVVAGLCERLRSRFGVAVAEVGDRDAWQTADLALACVFDTPGSCREVLDKAARLVESCGSVVVLEMTRDVR